MRVLTFMQRTTLIVLAVYKNQTKYPVHPRFSPVHPRFSPVHPPLNIQASIWTTQFIRSVITLPILYLRILFCSVMSVPIVHAITIGHSTWPPFLSKQITVNCSIIFCRKSSIYSEGESKTLCPSNIPHKKSHGIKSGDQGAWPFDIMT